MILLVLCSVFLIYILHILWYQKYSFYFKHLNKIPGPPGYPIIGNIIPPTSVEEIFKTDRFCYTQYYPIYKRWMLKKGAVYLCDPKDIELVLSNSKHNTKSGVYSFLHAWLRNGLLTSRGFKWQTRRRILTPAFHFNILQDFLPIFNKETRKLIDELKKYNGNCANVKFAITQFTLLSIAETSMGIKLDSSAKICDEYKTAIHNFGYSVVYRLVRPWLFSDRIFYNFTKVGTITKKSIEILHDFSRKVIADKRKIEERNVKAMLDIMLKAQNQGADIDDEGIAEEVDTFMFEGHDTTSLALCYIILLFANNPLYQNEVFDEIQDILGFPPKSPSYNDLKQLKLLERCIKEGLRLFPSVPFISRILGDDLVSSFGYRIPKKTVIHIPIFDLHRNPKIYPNPNKFDPDRFLPEKIKTRHPFAYLPFSAGGRNCIGQKFAMMELKSALCGILGNFYLETDDRIDDLVLITDIVLRCKNEIKVKFRSRNDKQ